MGSDHSSTRPYEHRDSKRPEGGVSLLFKYPMVALLLLFGMLYFIIMGVQALQKKPEPTLQKPETSTGPTTNVASTTDATALTEPRPSETPVNTEAAIPVTTITEPVITEPVIIEPATTEPPSGWMSVDDRYFYDALFIGDSRTDGICLYSTPGECRHFSNQSMTIFDILTTDKISAYGYDNLVDYLKATHFGKIYIMLGINECGSSTSSFAEQYRDVVNEIRRYQPDALIYIQSILYVTQKHERDYPVFASDNIKEKNNAIRALANDKDIFYLEVNDCMNDGTDHLPAEYSYDGAHLKGEYYDLWHNYLLDHAYVDAAHPWSPPDEDRPEPEGAELEHP